MISLALLDEVLEIDEENMTVTTTAGDGGGSVTDGEVGERGFGLTLANYASIREQQIAGFTQVGAHETGATVPPLRRRRVC